MIKRSLIAGRCDFLGVFDIAAANKPSELVLGHPVAPQLADGDRKIPGIAARVLGVVAGLEEVRDRSLGRAWKTRIDDRKLGNPD